MKENTYHRMTKKRPLRGLRLFKQKYLTKARLYTLLAKIHLVREVKNTLHQPYTDNDTLNKVQVLNHKIRTERGVFNLSYRADCIILHQNWWYESLFKKKRLYTINEDLIYQIAVEARSECESFLVKINPFNKGVVVHRGSPYVNILKPMYTPFIQDNIEYSEVIRVSCNFLNARLGFSIHTIAYKEEDISDTVKELLNKATAQIHNFVDGHPDEINEKLTGVKYDGDFHTSDGNKLIPNCICHKCGRPVFESSVEGYKAQCIFCDEDLYGIEIDKVDPKRYEEIYNYNKYSLFNLLSD